MNQTVTFSVKAPLPAVPVVFGSNGLSITDLDWEIRVPLTRPAAPAMELAAKKPAKGSKPKASSGTKKKKKGPGKLKDPGGGGGGSAQGPH